MTTDPTRPARRATILVWLWLASDIAIALASLWQINVLGGFGGTMRDHAAIELSDDIAAVTGGLFMLMFLLSGVAVLRWIFLVNRNAHQWSETMTISPGWNVGWFFVPIATLWKPFVGVRESWAATVSPDDPQAVTTPYWMRVWWGLWLATNVFGQVTFRATMAAKDVATAIEANWLYVLGLAIDVPLAILLVKLMTELSSLQRHRLS